MSIEDKGALFLSARKQALNFLRLSYTPLWRARAVLAYRKDWKVPEIITKALMPEWKQTVLPRDEMQAFRAVTASRDLLDCVMDGLATVVSEDPFILHLTSQDGVLRRDHFYDKDGMELRSHHMKAPRNMDERWAAAEELKLIIKYEPKRESTDV